MEIRLFIIFIFITFQFNCLRNENICFENVSFKKVDNSSLFFIQDIENDCEYRLKFTCSKDDSSGRIKFDGDTYFISFRSKVKYLDLFGLKDSIGLVKTFPTYFNCLQDEKEAYSFQLTNKLYRTEDIVLCIKIDSVFFDQNIGYLDYNFFLSNKFGLLGNYLTNPLLENVIMQEHGDIVKDAIDYSNVEFRRIM